MWYIPLQNIGNEYKMITMSEETNLEINLNNKILQVVKIFSLHHDIW